LVEEKLIKEKFIRKELIKDLKGKLRKLLIIKVKLSIFINKL